MNKPPDIDTTQHPEGALVSALDGLSPRLAPDVFVAPGATIVGDVRAGATCSFWYASVARGDVVPIILGDGVNVQDGAVLHGTQGRNPCRLDDEVTVGHRAIVHGAHIEARALIGMGAIILDDARVGTECLVGAGALVTSGTVVPPGSLVLGSPAKVVRQLTDEERAGLAASAEHYRQMARLHSRARREARE